MNGTHARRLDTPLPTYPAPPGYPLGEGTPIRLVPVRTEREARTFLVRWLVCYAMVRKARDLAFIAKHEGLGRARMEGRRRGVFVD